MMGRRSRIVTGLTTVLLFASMAGSAAGPAHGLLGAATGPQVSAASLPMRQPKPARRLGGITVSPAFQNVTVSDTKPTDTYEFAMTNNTSEPVEFALTTVDFGSLDETGGVLFQGATSRTINYRYGLSRYATLERDRLTIEPKKTEKVRLTITNKESLTPGGHYGAVLATPTQNGQRPTRVQINQVLSSLLFVRKQGGEIYQLNLREYWVKRQLFDAPKAVDMRFQNAGNVHVIPRGIVTITDPRGREVRRGFINGGSAIILPQTFRRLTVPLENTGMAWLPGTYKLTIAYRYDGSENLQQRTYDFTYVNAWYVVLMAALLAVAVLLAVSRRARRAVRRMVGEAYRVLRRAVAWLRGAIRKIF